MGLLPPGGEIIADGGFRGNERFIIPYRRAELTTPTRLRHNQRLQSLRWVVEAAFSRLKSFGALAHVYRHRLSMHKLVFLAIVALYNIDIVYHPLVAP